MIFNRTSLSVLGGVCTALLFSASVSAKDDRFETSHDCNDIIYLGREEATDNRLAICASKDNVLFAAWEEGEGNNKNVTEISFDAEIAEWRKNVKDVSINNKSYKETETSLVIGRGFKSNFTLTSKAIGLENNTNEATFKIVMRGGPERIFKFNPSTVLNGIGVKLKDKYNIPGEVVVSKGAN